MLKRATYLENVALRLHHDVLKSLSATMAGAKDRTGQDRIWKHTLKANFPSHVFLTGNQ